MIEASSRSDSPPESARARTGPASARIQAWIREQIVGMRLAPGAALSEKEISETFGVSRTPVREALLRLAEERLIDVFPQYGTFVSRISLEAVRDAMVIRDALERIAVREATAKATRADIAELKHIIQRQRVANRADDIIGFHQEDEIFHQTIARIARHPNLWRVIRREKAQVDRCRMLTLPSAPRRRFVIAQHEAIVEAIQDCEVGGAENAMHAHLAAVLPSFEEVRQAYPDYFEGDTPGAAARPARAAGGEPCEERPE